MLRTNLQFIIEEQSLQVIAVSSAHPGEGKTTTIVNLAITFANEGKRVVLIDADLRRSSLHSIFDLSNERGLSSILSKRCHTKDATRSSLIENLDIIPAGPMYPNPSELLHSPEMMELLAQLKSQYDLVLIDSPPVLVVADAKIIANRAEGVIMIVRSRKTKRSSALKAKNYLESSGVNILGFVLNNQMKNIERNYYGYYNHAGKR